MDATATPPRRHTWRAPLPRKGRGDDVWWAAAVALATSGLIACIGLQWPRRNDYLLGPQGSVDALRDGHVGEFLRAGGVEAGAFLLRAPFVLLGDAFGGGGHTAYRMLAVPGLLACLVFALALFAHARKRGAGMRAALVGVALVAGSPFVLSSLSKGHAEEPLGAVLCIAAVWAARHQRWVAGSLLLGLAIGNKPWAVVAVVPVLMLLDSRHVRALVLTGLTAAVVYAPFLLAGPSGLRTEAGAVHATGAFKPWQIWWFFGDSHHLHREPFGLGHALYRDGPAWVEHLSHPLAVLVPVVLSLALIPMLRRRPRADVLLLLATCFLLRAMLDTWNNVYYLLPAVFALVAWELSTSRGVPRVTLFVTLIAWPMLALVPFWISPDAQALAFLMWSVPLLVALMVRLVAPERAPRWAVPGPRSAIARA